MTKYPYNKYLELTEYLNPLDFEEQNNQIYDLEDIDDYIFGEEEKSFSER